MVRATLPSRRSRSPGVAVKPEAVRQARQEAGLTQAQLAGSQLTRGAIHLIEVGRARPSAATLELIASRTGRPLTYFLLHPGNQLDGRQGLTPSTDAAAIEQKHLIEAVEKVAQQMGEVALALSKVASQLGSIDATLRRRLPKPGNT